MLYCRRVGINVVRSTIFFSSFGLKFFAFLMLIILLGSFTKTFFFQGGFVLYFHHATGGVYSAWLEYKNFIPFLQAKFNGTFVGVRVSGSFIKTSVDNFSVVFLIYIGS